VCSRYKFFFETKSIRRSDLSFVECPIPVSNTLRVDKKATSVEVRNLLRRIGFS